MKPFNIIVSSGTLSILTGKRSYEELEQISNDFYTWLESSGESYGNFLEAWKGYLSFKSLNKESKKSKL